MACKFYHITPQLYISAAQNIDHFYNIENISQYKKLESRSIIFSKEFF
jgi:hypothetical protein